MEWWEYLIVLVFGFGLWVKIAEWCGWDLTGREGQEAKKVNFILSLVTVCFFLVLLSIYKLFIDPIW